MTSPKIIEDLKKIKDTLEKALRIYKETGLSPSYCVECNIVYISEIPVHNCPFGHENSTLVEPMNFEISKFVKFLNKLIERYENFDKAKKEISIKYFRDMIYDYMIISIDLEKIDEFIKKYKEERKQAIFKDFLKKND